MYTFWQDLRFSLRVLARHRGFTATSIAVLALGIGVNAGIFTLINSLLLRPRTSSGIQATLVGVHSLERATSGSSRAFSYPNYQDLREAGRPFTHLAAHNLAMAGVADGETTRRAMVDIVSANYFETLGVGLALGRTFTSDEERPGCAGLRGDRELLRVGADRLRRRHARAHGGPERPLLHGGRRRAARLRRHDGRGGAGLLRAALGTRSDRVGSDFRLEKTLDRRDYHRLLLVGRFRRG